MRLRSSRVGAWTATARPYHRQWVYPPAVSWCQTRGHAQSAKLAGNRRVFGMSGRRFEATHEDTPGKGGPARGEARGLSGGGLTGLGGAAAWIMVPGELEEQRMQGPPALGIERGQHLALQALENGAQSDKDSPSVGRETNHVPTPVARVSLAADQPALLERVENPYQLAPVELERVGDRRLRLSRLFAQKRKDAVVVEAESCLLDFYDCLACEVVTETCQQDRSAGQKLLGQARRRYRELSYLSSHGN